ncbi:hypothetical protein [Anaerosphaera multitolerans]|uniref:hypothetical protein n=1 Tax=Anaerosphaera multitolerans TaxID=2487351 RepID=UPI000FDC933B|nr:hypothetical protein [Anaerosphaera multitolerans]
MDKLGWTDRNYNVLKDIIKKYGIEDFKDKYEKNFVVSDWDNTVLMYDVQDAVFLYQLENLDYNFNSFELKYILEKDIVYPKGKEDFIDNLISEIVEDYEKLCALKEKLSLEEIKKEQCYSNFIAKMVYIHMEVNFEMGYKIYCYRMLYLFYNMAEEEVRTLSQKAIEHWLKRDMGIINFNARLRKGQRINYDFKVGLRKIQEQINLFSALRESNIDVYICTSSLQIVIEEFALNEKLGYGFKRGEVKGLKLLVDERGKFLPEVDEEGMVPILEGKREYLNYLSNLYSKPPILFMGDSDGDYYALTYEKLKVALIVNANDDELIGALKRKAKEECKEGTLYLLQGRDEINYSFRNSTKSITRM